MLPATVPPAIVLVGVEVCGAFVAEAQRAQQRAMRAADSSPLGTKPLAPLAPTSGPNSRGSRLEVSTTFGVAPSSADARRDVEPVEVGEVDVEQDEVGVQLARGLEAAGAVLGLADDVEALVLQQQARRGAEARVIVDDEDLHGHTSSVPGARVFSVRVNTTCPRGCPVSARRGTLLRGRWQRERHLACNSQGTGADALSCAL